MTSAKLTTGDGDQTLDYGMGPAWDATLRFKKEMKSGAVVHPDGKEHMALLCAPFSTRCSLNARTRGSSFPPSPRRRRRRHHVQLHKPVSPRRHVAQFRAATAHGLGDKGAARTVRLRL